MNQNNQSFEEIINQVLQNQEAGRELFTGIEITQQQRQEISEILEMQKMMEQSKENIQAPKEMLSNILDQLPEREKLFSFWTPKRLSLGLGSVGAFLLLITSIIVWQPERKMDIPENPQLAYETEKIDQDIADLERILSNDDFASLNDSLESIITDSQ